MKSYSILLLGTQMAVGGAQKLLLEQAQWFQDRGHKVVAFFFYDRDNLHKKWRGAYSFPIQSLQAFNKQTAGLKNFPKLLAGVWKLWRHLKRNQYDAIITFTHDSNLLGMPLAWLAGIQARVGTHLGEIRGMPVWRQWLHTLLVNFGVIGTLVASSTRTRENAIRHGIRPERIKVIHNAIAPIEVVNLNRADVRRELNLHDDDIFLLAVGRLVYEKGHEFLVEAMSIIGQTSENILAGICGVGPLFEHLDGQIKALGLQEKVRLLGQWDDLSELLCAADVFVLPSRWEGLPIALLEAMSAGLPVVATRVEGVEEVIQDGEHGLLVPVENAKALADAILQLAHDSQRRQTMGTAAHQRIRQAFTIDGMCEQYLEIISGDLLKGPSTEKANLG